MAFRISGLAPEPFTHLYGLDAPALARHNARRCVADAKPGFPCRVGLEDAEPGEPVLLLHYVHQPAATPFRASHAIYVREGALAAARFENEIPPALRTRTLSLRAFDAGGMLIDAALVGGDALEPSIRGLLAKAETAYLHAHYATRGCYAALIERSP